MKRDDGVNARIVAKTQHLEAHRYAGKYGLYIGFVVDDRDKTNHGMLKVHILDVSTTENEPIADMLRDNKEISGKWCSPMFPSMGATLLEDDVITYGIVGPQPRNGDTVCVMFIQGDVNRPVWIGSLPPPLQCMTIPGLPSMNVTGETDYFLPGAERPRDDTLTKTHSPAGVLAENIKASGLANDLHRGAGISGMTRETPSRVAGIKTRGNPADGMPGHQIVLDDLPETQHVRLRTSTGNQILLSDSARTIYISTAKGNSRLELYENGDIELFAEGDFSINARGSMNLGVGQNLNIDVGGNVNMTVGGNVKAHVVGAFHAKTQSMFVETTQEMNFKAGGKLRLASLDQVHLKSATETFFQSGGNLNLKSAAFIYMDAATKVESQAGIASEAVLATAPTMPTQFSLSGPKTLGESSTGTQGAAVQTVLGKMPQREPYVRSGRILEPALRVPEHGEPSPFDFDEHEALLLERSGFKQTGRSGISRPNTGIPKDPSQGEVIENSHVKYIVVHGSAHSKNSWNVTLADIDGLHRRLDKVGNRLAYHYVIRRNGQFENGVPTSPQVIHGNHTGSADFNRMSIGICMIGGGKAGNVNAGEANYTCMQYATLRTLIEQLRGDFKSITTVVGHRDIKATTACPSFDVDKWYKQSVVVDTNTNKVVNCVDFSTPP